MPFTALAWNIEEFGDKFGKFDSPMIMEDLRCALVGAIVKAAQADVVVIQELRKSGVPFLGQLVAEFNIRTGKTWHYDWLPAALTTSVYPGTLFSQLGFAQTANSEGYAVLWRAGALEAFAGSKLSAGIDTPDPTKSGLDDSRDRYLGLAFSGRPLKFDDRYVDVTFDATGAFGQAGFPQSICAPRNSKTELRSGAELDSNESMQQQINVRRPCGVKLKVTSTRSVPLIVFHTPVGQQNSRSQRCATYMGFACEQLQVADCVYAGDFNCRDPITQAILQNYPSILSPPYVANTYLPNENKWAQSMVHYLNKKSGEFRTGSAVFGSARDYAFARQGGGAPTLSVRNVLDLDILADNGAVRTALYDVSSVIQLFAIPGIAKTAGQKVADVLNDFFNGQPPQYGDKYTAAAVVYRTLISDHLPVAISFA